MKITRELAVEAIKDCVDIKRIAMRHGVAYSTVATDWIRRGDFPPALGRLGNTRFWWGPDVARWKRERDERLVAWAEHAAANPRRPGKS